MIAFKDGKDGYYQFDWDGISALPAWTKDMTKIDVRQPAISTPEQIRDSMQPLSAWQVRKVLTQFNLREKVETAIANADQNTKDAWQYAKEFQRNDILLNGMATALGLTDEQLDELFTVGITL